MSVILHALLGTALFGCVASVAGARVLPKPAPSTSKSDPQANGKHAPAPQNASPADSDTPSAPPPNGAIVVGRVAQEAKLLNAPKATYPPLARSAKVQGVCRFNVLINENGAVSNVQLVRGHPLLVNAAREAVLRYRYNKTVIDGVDKKVWTIVDVNFSLSQ